MANCDDRANVVAARANYVFQVPANVGPHGACMILGRQPCQNPNGTNHRNAAGAVVAPHLICATCLTQAAAIVDEPRHEVPAPVVPGAAPVAVVNLRSRRDLLPGVPNGAHTRGRLCDTCIDREIFAYLNRRYVQGQSEPKAASTCKCSKELFNKRYCAKDKIRACDGIQARTDANAGPAGWLERLDFLGPPQNRAILYQPGSQEARVLQARRAAPGNNLSLNACRCGRDMPAPPPPPLPPAVAPVPVVISCTACSGVVINSRDPYVEDFEWDDPPQDGEANLDYGRF